jgi:peptidoglycan/LPS O-acetylase OafA/YrhL
VSALPIPAAPRRSALIDCAKALACTAIVWHHLAFYGPLSEAVHQGLPGLIDWLAEYARMAVQVFLVLGGYLAAASLAPQGQARFDRPWRKVAGRFVRLVVPYAVALIVAIIISAAVRPWFNDPSVSGEPTLGQLLAHALLLQSILDQESLSAGVWYVAIDFQLFALATLLLAGAARAGAALRARPLALTGAQALVALGVAASLYGFNRDERWDVWAVYFFGAYGLGMLACWAVNASSARGAWGWRLLIAALTLGALALQWRTRIALAGCTALTLALTLRNPALTRWTLWAPLRRLGLISYSVFLVHFPVCLLANAVISRLLPGSFGMACAGMALAYGLSIAAGNLLYQRVERHMPTWRAALRWEASLVGAGLLAAWLAGIY